MRQENTKKKKWQILVEVKQLENALGTSFYFLSQFSFFLILKFPFGFSSWHRFDRSEGWGKKYFTCLWKSNFGFYFPIDICPLFLSCLDFLFGCPWGWRVSVFVAVSLSSAFGDANFRLPVNGDSCSGLADLSLYRLSPFSRRLSDRTFHFFNRVKVSPLFLSVSPFLLLYIYVFIY